MKYLKGIYIINNDSYLGERSGIIEKVKGNKVSFIDLLSNEYCTVPIIKDSNPHVSQLLINLRNVPIHERWSFLSERDQKVINRLETPTLEDFTFPTSYSWKIYLVQLESERICKLEEILLKFSLIDPKYFAYKE